MKVQWSHLSEKEATWEHQDRFRSVPSILSCFFSLRSRDEILCWWGRAVTAQNQQFQILCIILVFPIGVKLCTINLCNNPCGRKMPKHFSDHLKGLFPFPIFPSWLIFAIFPKFHLFSLNLIFWFPSCFAMMKLCANFHDFIMSRKWGCSSNGI